MLINIPIQNPKSKIQNRIILVFVYALDCRKSRAQFPFYELLYTYRKFFLLMDELS